MGSPTIATEHGVDVVVLVVDVIVEVVLLVMDVVVEVVVLVVDGVVEVEVLVMVVILEAIVLQKEVSIDMLSKDVEGNIDANTATERVLALVVDGTTVVAVKGVIVRGSISTLIEVANVGKVITVVGLVVVAD